MEGRILVEDAGAVQGTPSTQQGLLGVLHWCPLSQGASGIILSAPTVGRTELGYCFVKHARPLAKTTLCSLCMVIMVTHGYEGGHSRPSMLSTQWTVSID